MQQTFTLPHPIISYIMTMKNGTSENWTKLLKTCKYFFWKVPVFPVETITFRKNWITVDMSKNRYSEMYQLPRIPFLLKSKSRLWIQNSVNIVCVDLSSTSLSTLIRKNESVNIYIENSIILFCDFIRLIENKSARNITLDNCQFVFGKIPANSLVDVFAHVFTCLERLTIYYDNNTVVQLPPKQMLKLSSQFSNLKEMRMLKLSPNVLSELEIKTHFKSKSHVRFFISFSNGQSFAKNS